MGRVDNVDINRMMTANGYDIYQLAPDVEDANDPRSLADASGPHYEQACQAVVATLKSLPPHRRRLALLELYSKLCKSQKTCER